MLTRTCTRTVGDIEIQSAKQTRRGHTNAYEGCASSIQHFEYQENGALDLDVTWQQVDLTVPS
jgi:hypothetical protein